MDTGKVKSDNFFVMLAAGVLIVAVLAVLLGPQPGSSVPIKELPRFANYNDLKAAFEESDNALYKRGGILDTAVMPLATESASQGAFDSSAGAAGIPDFSETNVQVEGVDEADIIKTDGKYVYAFSQGKLVITDAYPVETGEVVAKLELGDTYPVEMFVNGDKLLLFGNTSYYKNGESSGDGVAESVMPQSRCYDCGWRSGFVSTQLYDISNRSDPVLEKETMFEGSYLTARMIGEQAYFVVNSYVYFYGDKEDDIIPLMVEDGVESRVAEPTEIGNLYPLPAESLVTLVSMNMDTGDMQKETVAGSAQNVYASSNNIYLAATSWLPSTDVPVAREAEELIVGGSEHTVISKFNLSDGAIGFVGTGNVPGHVLNQFSMDEYEGNFRVATTLRQNWRTESQSRNNLYVLDEELNRIGTLEGLAPGERIYSARFMGEKAYMVTFRKIDPLFVIDVSDPTNPNVLGKLKIPGYSDYLHPIDETHIIGIGKDTVEAAKGDFAWYQGMKMAVFDVSDVSNPVEMHKIVIGDRGTDSYALHDHKAFLFDEEKELLVLPVMLAEIPEGEKAQDFERWPSYGEPVFQGAFVYKLTLENGFEERGRITHISEEEELKRGYYFGNEYSVKRSLYIGEVLYTYSEKMLKANSLTTLEDLKEFDFGYQSTSENPYY